MSDPVKILSIAVDLLRLAGIGLAEWDKVSRIIQRRIAEGRDEWTYAERAEIEAALDAASVKAKTSVDDLP